MPFIHSRLGMQSICQGLLTDVHVSLTCRDSGTGEKTQSRLASQRTLNGQPLSSRPTAGPGTMPACLCRPGLTVQNPTTSIRRTVPLLLRRLALQCPSRHMGRSALHEPGSSLANCAFIVRCQGLSSSCHQALTAMCTAQPAAVPSSSVKLAVQAFGVLSWSGQCRWPPKTPWRHPPAQPVPPNRGRPPCAMCCSR